MGWFKTFLQHHLPWDIIVLELVVGFHAWHAEHDARLPAQQKIAADEQQVAVLGTPPNFQRPSRPFPTHRTCDCLVLMCSRCLELLRMEQWQPLT